MYMSEGDHWPHYDDDEDDDEDDDDDYDDDEDDDDCDDGDDDDDDDHDDDDDDDDDHDDDGQWCPSTIYVRSVISRSHSKCEVSDLHQSCMWLGGSLGGSPVAPGDAFIY